MKQLYIFKILADKAMSNYEGNYDLSTCDVNSLDCGSCDKADAILSTAMGEVACYRDRNSREIICAWWQDDDIYEGTVMGVRVTATCAADGSITIDSDEDIDEDLAETIKAQF